MNTTCAADAGAGLGVRFEYATPGKFFRWSGDVAAGSASASTVGVPMRAAATGAEQAPIAPGSTFGAHTAEGVAIGAATGAGPQIVYRPTTGALFFDINGAAAGGASQFATLTGAPVLVASDFLIV